MANLVTKCKLFIQNTKGRSKKTSDLVFKITVSMDFSLSWNWINIKMGYEFLVAITFSNGPI